MARIKKAKISFISLCERGANKVSVLYKSDGSVEFNPVWKSDMTEEGIIKALVYIPEHRDAQGDIASAEVIKEAAHEFLANKGGVDIRHDFKEVEKSKASIIESYIVAKGNHEFDGITDRDGKAIDPTGAWAVSIKIGDENLRKLYREGKWNGVSMGGTGILEVEKSDEDGFIQKIIKALTTLGKSGDSGDTDMKPEDLKPLFEAQTASLAKAIADAIAGTKPAEPKKDEPKQEPVTKSFEAPKFDGDPSSADDIRAYERKVRVAKAQFDFAADPTKLVAELRKINEELADDTSDLDKEANVSKDDSDEVKQLKRKLAKELRKSNQKAGDPFIGKSQSEIEKALADEILAAAPYAVTK